MHYLIVVPTGGIVVHHRRTAAGAVESTSDDGGTIVLEPPGLTLDVTAWVSRASDLTGSLMVRAGATGVSNHPLIDSLAVHMSCPLEPFWFETDLRSSSP